MPVAHPAAEYPLGYLTRRREVARISFGLMPEKAGMPDVELPNGKYNANNRHTNFNHEMSLARQSRIVGVDLFGRGVVVVVTT
jgi:hypothetical protein